MRYRWLRLVDNARHRFARSICRLGRHSPHCYGRRDHLRLDGSLVGAR